MGSLYFQSLTSTLHDSKLLTDELKAVLLEHDIKYNSKPSLKMPFGKFKGESISNILNMDKGRSYLEWVARQEYVKEKFQDILAEIRRVL